MVVSPTTEPMLEGMPGPEPLRLVIQRRVDRLMYGDRHDPYPRNAEKGQAVDAVQETLGAALLLLGSSEPHYTPSKVFPALRARRPDPAGCVVACSTPEVAAMVALQSDSTN